MGTNTLKKNEKTHSTGKIFLTSLITGVTAFAICILLFPLIIMKSDDPVSFVPAAAGASVAICALASSFEGTRKGANPLLCGIICSAVLCALIFATGTFFSDTQQADTAFTAVIFGCAVLFSFVGAFLGKKRKAPKHKKRKR